MTWGIFWFKSVCHLRNKKSRFLYQSWQIRIHLQSWKEKYTRIEKGGKAGNLRRSLELPGFRLGNNQLDNRPRFPRDLDYLSKKGSLCKCAQSSILGIPKCISCIMVTIDQDICFHKGFSSSMLASLTDWWVVCRFANELKHKSRVPKLTRSKCPPHCKSPGWHNP